jgi:hypothetical protein
MSTSNWVSFEIKSTKVAGIKNQCYGGIPRYILFGVGNS